MRCLVLGGGGPVGTSLLYILQQQGWTTAVVDPKRPKHWSLHQQRLHGTVEDWLERHVYAPDLPELLRRSAFDAVIDLSPTMDKRKSVEICDELGVSMINSTMVDCKDDIHIAAYNFIDRRPTVRRRPHIVASGMNPGAVNSMAEEIIQAHGQPDAIVFWEYDDTTPHDGVFHGPCTTWCPGESGPEIAEDWNFEVLEEGAVLLHEDALDDAPRTFRDCGIPFDQLPVPPDSDAFLIGHEECIYMGWRHDTAVRFIYGFHPENMRQIRAAGYHAIPELLACIPGQPLPGKDIVGVSCRYNNLDKWFGQYCMLENTAATPIDSNATCYLVASGMMASVLALQNQGLQPGVHLTHEIPDWLRCFRTIMPTHACVVTENEEVIA